MFLFSFIFLSNPSYAWLSGFNYRRQVNFIENSGNNLVDYPKSFWFYHGGKANSICSDIRLVNDTSNSIVPFGLRNCNSTHVELIAQWNVSASSTSTLYVYYGNTTAVEFANSTWKDIQYNLWDDFSNSTISQSKWNYYSGGATCYVNGTSFYGSSGSNNDCSLWSKKKFNTNFMNISVYLYTLGSWGQSVFISNTTPTNGTNGDAAITNAFGGTPNNTAGNQISNYNTAFYAFYFVNGVNTNIYSGTPISKTETVQLINNGTQLRYYEQATQRATWTKDSSLQGLNYLGIGQGFDGSSYNGGSYIDDFYAYQCLSCSNLPEPTYSIGVEELPNQAPQITIFLPANTTYFYSNNFQFNFKATDDSSATFQLKAFLDGSSVYDNSSYQNNTQINITQNLNLPKQYNFTVWANDTQGATSTLTTIFTIKDFEIQQITFNSIVYETTTQSFTETIRVNFDLVSNITADLFWNSTDKGSCSQSVNSTHILLSIPIDIPLIQTNNTAINFFFRNYITYANGSSITTDSSTNTQNILFAYIPQNIVLGDNFLEYDDIKPTLNITILYNNSQTQFSYLWNLTNGTDYKTASEVNPTIINFENYLANETRNLTLTLNISFQNSSRTHNLSKNFTSYMAMLTNCSYLSTTKTLSFIFKDEETQNTLSPMNYTYISVYVSPQNLRKQRFYDFTNLQDICIYPSWATYFANVSAVARKDNYAVATHVPYQTSVLTNSSQTITIYLIPLSVSSPITFTLPGSNYIFVAERQYGSNFVYIRSDLSDFNRKIVMYLRPYDTYYRITIYSEIGQLCFASSEFKVASSTYEITSCAAITNISYPSPWYQKNINYTCTKTQNGNITNVKCDFYALDNLDHDFYLVVYKYSEPWGKTLYSNQTLHAISGSLSVDLGEGAYDVYLYAHSDPDYLWADFVNNKVLIVSTEIFFFLLLLYCLSCVVGWFNPFIGLLFNIVITFIASFLGLATFPQQAIAGLTILFIFAIMFTREWK
jgi:hypothetical protein